MGSFSSQDNARRLAGQLDAKGFTAYLLPLQSNGKTLQRVRVGPVATRDEAEALARRLKASGFEGQVTRQSAGAGG
jgi:DedD protein